ncbi:MAG: hypothetical protein BWX71_02070 [Deltaproteobacteria bacterium ADurb.Bin072]|nr:MAG: hypothetical protein BWX71_02070 [Deltaproteobacteria bacterium ADurb.Bin072]
MPNSFSKRCRSDGCRGSAAKLARVTLKSLAKSYPISRALSMMAMRKLGVPVYPVTLRSLMSWTCCWVADAPDGTTVAPTRASPPWKVSPAATMWYEKAFRTMSFPPNPAALYALVHRGSSDPRWGS